MASARGPQREEYAAGDVLLRFPGSDPARLVILSPIAKPGWRARAEATPTRPLFPGSAIAFEGTLFEIHTASTPRGTEPHRYELRAWENRFPIRETFEYSREEAQRVRAAIAAAQRKGATAHLFAWLLPLVGLLPRRLQDAIEAEYGVPAARATFWSALLTLGLSSTCTLVAIQAGLSLSMGGPRPGAFSRWALHWVALTGYLVLESIVRYRLSFPAGIAIGSAPVALPLLAVLALIDLGRGRSAAPPTPAVPTAVPTARIPAGARDAVRDLPDGRLEILSLLPKPHWGTRSAIHYRDAWWALDDRQELPPSTAAAPRWRFVLAAWPEHVLVQDPQRYSPDEVRGLAHDAARERWRSAVESLGPLLGLLPGAVQRRLADVYGHDARSRTGWSLVLVGGSAAFAIATAGARFARGAGSPVDAGLAIVAGGLLVEAAVRTVSLLRGEIRGSVLGALVRPFAERALRLGQDV